MPGDYKLKSPNQEDCTLFRTVSNREAENEDGKYQSIEMLTENVQLRFPGIELIESDLQLIYGVGAATAQKLRTEGYHTLLDLIGHSRWQRAAAELLRFIETRDIQRLARYGASDLHLLSFFKPEEVKFIDIETSGLYYINPVFLVGILYFVEGRGVIRQFLARDYSEEKAILRETEDQLRHTALIASYNGRSFDLPYLKGRMRFHNMNEASAGFHIDLLRSTRKDWRRVLPNCRLLTIEKYLLAEERENDLPGSMVAEYYNRYIQTRQTDYIEAILQHNRQDLLTMAKLLGILITTRRKEAVDEN